MLTIKNPGFIPFLEMIDKDSDITLYRFIENLIFETSNDAERFLGEIKTIGLEKTLESIKAFVDSQIIKDQDSSIVIKNPKRKNVKDEMIENYIIKKGLDTSLLRKIKMAVCLKILGSKNLIVKDGEITGIVINGVSY